MAVLAAELFTPLGAEVREQCSQVGLCEEE